MLPSKSAPKLTVTIGSHAPSDKVTCPECGCSFSPDTAEPDSDDYSDMPEAKSVRVAPPMRGLKGVNPFSKKD